MAELSLKEKTAKGLFWGGISNGLQQILSLVFSPERRRLDIVLLFMTDLVEWELLIPTIPDIPFHPNQKYRVRSV